MSQLEIKILLECYISTEPGANVPSLIWNSPAAREARECFYQTGIIRSDTNQVTTIGQLTIDRLLAVPLLEFDE